MRVVAVHRRGEEVRLALVEEAFRPFDRHRKRGRAIYGVVRVVAAPYRAVIRLPRIHCTCMPNPHCRDGVDAAKPYRADGRDAGPVNRRHLQHSVGGDFKRRRVNAGRTVRAGPVKGIDYRCVAVTRLGKRHLNGILEDASGQYLTTAGVCRNDIVLKRPDALAPHGHRPARLAQDTCIVVVGVAKHEPEFAG